jgi:hypothetical protein
VTRNKNYITLFIVDMAANAHLVLGKGLYDLLEDKVVVD